MKSSFLLLFVLLCLGHLQAQTHEIIGIVKGSDGDFLTGATAQLLKSQDSSFVKAGFIDGDGKFSLPVNKGNYILIINMLGYKRFSKDVTYEGTHVHDVGTITMELQGKELETVQITGTKPMIEMKAGKVVFNVENSVNATGSNALEMLRKSPGVLVDNNDNVSLKGKNGVRVYIDGKMVQMNGTDLAEYLKTINSNDIEAIEMISSPGARFDASGNAGIINIKLKKNKNYGTNGNVSLGFIQGVTPKGNAALSMNHRNDKIAIFSNLSGDIGARQHRMNFYRTQGDTIFDQHSINSRDGKSGAFKVGLDYFINKKNTLGFSVNGSLNDGKSDNMANTEIYQKNSGEFVKTLFAKNYGTSNRTNVNANVNYRFTDTLENELSVDLDYGLYRGKSDSYQPNYYLDANQQLLYEVINRNNTPTDIDFLTAKVDASHNLWKGKLGYGAKMSHVKTKNTFDFFNDYNGQTIKILSRSNYFEYTEQVLAAYLNFDKNLGKKIEMQLGLRMEHTNSLGELTRADSIIQSDNTVKRNYLDFFPNIAFTYNLHPKHSLNLTYTRRIDRPTYQELNPFENKLDELSYQKGNAFLKPMYTNTVAFSHTFNHFLTTTIDYSYIKDYTTMITDTTNGNASYIQERNLSNQQIWGASIGSPLMIKKWWNGYLSVYGNYQIYNGAFGSNIVDTKVTSYGLYMSNTFTINKTLNAELSGWFSGPSIWGGTWRNKSQGGIDVGLQKTLFKKRLTIKASLTDIFFTNPWNAVSDYAGVNFKGSGSWESRTFRLNLTYRFGNSQVKVNQRKSGSESESKRIKN